MAFDYDDFIKYHVEREEAWRKRFREGKVRVTADELGAQTTNPFVKLYDDAHRDFFTKPYKLQQHRMQYVRVANQHFNEGRSTFVVFRTDEGFLKDPEGYYGASIDEVVRQCVGANEPDKMPRMIPMILDPASYLGNPVLKELYAPVFRALYEAGQRDVLAYANRMEDCLTLQKYEGRWKRWEDFRVHEVKIFTDAGLGKVELEKQGDLPATRLDDYLGTRVAWLKLLDLENLAKAITDLALRKGKVRLARDLAYVLHTLFITPIFYSHKTTSVLHAPYDTRDMLLPVIEEYWQEIEDAQREKRDKFVEDYAEVLALLIIVAGCLAFTFFVERPETLTVDWAIRETPHTLHISHELLLGKEPVINLFAQLNQQSYSHAFALGQRSPGDLVLTGEDLVKLREDLVEERKPLLSELQDIPGVTIRTVTMIPIVASLWVPTDSRFALVRKALEMFGKKGTALANKIQLFLERWWPAIPRYDNPVLHYKPVFIIHDFSKPPLADTLVSR